jgi:hypothetical protein
MKGGTLMVPLHYVGHPLFDVGLATITTFVDKDDPTELTVDDLDKVADYIETYYIYRTATLFIFDRLADEL